MANKKRGTLIIVGGHEDRTGEKVILREVAARAGPGRLVVTTVASEDPDGLFEQYERAFRSLGVAHVYNLPIAEREEARTESRVRTLDGATVVFFTGGDQLKITSQIGDTPVFERLREIYAEGGTIAGTSAGASVVCETMLVSGNGEQSPRVGETVRMAPGLGFLENVIIDQHFAERGRMGRLLGAIAQNPRNLGLGLDENTAVVIEEDRRFTVLGDGSVYVIDGSGVTRSNIAEEDAEQSLSIHDVRLHVLSRGDGFDLRERRPGPLSRREEERLLVSDGEAARGKS